MQVSRRSLPLGCLAILLFSVAGCRDNSLATFVTFGVGIPKGAKVVAEKRGPPMAPDSRDHLIFDTDDDGVEWFASRYSGGTPLSEYHESRSKLKGASGNHTWQDKVQGIPWNLDAISNGRFYRRNDTNGFVSIDMDRFRVYVFR